ncbi:MAG: UDP-glucuronate decarboxylase [uncultured bacterium]|nr:MAG: UDP-glucuronate decarboxylase [uncultured bacterium]
MQSDDGRVISNFVTQAISGKPLTMYGNGKQTRSFCYVADMVEGLILAMEKNVKSGEVINVGFPKEQTIKNIAEIILKLTESSAVIISCHKQEDDPQRRKPDIAKAKKLLGWQPETSLFDGLSKTINYFRNL